MPINTTEAFAFGSKAVTDAGTSTIASFTGLSAALVELAARAVISVSGGNVNIRWDGSSPVATAGGGIQIVGLPAAAVNSNAVFVIEGANNISSVLMIATTASTPTVAVILEK